MIYLGPHLLQIVSDGDRREGRGEKRRRLFSFSRSFVAFVPCPDYFAKALDLITLNCLPSLCSNSATFGCEKADVGPIIARFGLFMVYNNQAPDLVGYLRICLMNAASFACNVLGAYFSRQYSIACCSFKEPRDVS